MSLRTISGKVIPSEPPAPLFWEFALFKRSNGHQVGGPVRVRAAADPRVRGLKPERYIVRRRAVYTGPWEDA